MSFKCSMKFFSIGIITLIMHCNFSGVKANELDKFYATMRSEGLAASGTILLNYANNRQTAWCKATKLNETNHVVYHIGPDGEHPIIGAREDVKKVLTVRCRPFNDNVGFVDVQRYYIVPHRKAFSVFIPNNPYETEENWATEDIIISYFKEMDREVIKIKP